MISKQGIQKLFDLDVEETAPGIIIFSDQVTERLQYTCRFVFGHVLGLRSVVTSDRHEFESSSFFKINYSVSLASNSLHILPSGLLFEKGIPAVEPKVTFQNDTMLLFAAHKSEHFSFDIFSAVFYMISRCEEWQNSERDQHQRFELAQSLLYRHKVHLKPVTDVWVGVLRQALSKFFPDLIFPRKHSKVIATIDVDNLYAYRSKGLLRTSGALVKDLIKFNFKNLARRLSVVVSGQKDPFDIYEGFSKFCYGHNIPLFWFFLFRSGTRYDRTIDPKTGVFKEVLLTIRNNHGNIGLHPSYETSSDRDLLQSEVAAFSTTLREQVTISRQHYLRFNIRTTPGQLIKNGIHTDFTMGFASGPGFRAGTCFPFPYYDFSKETEDALLFIPFCAMDGAYMVYDRVSADAAFESLLQLREETKKVNGPFITVFHERTFAPHLYPGFGEMYKKLITRS